MVEQRHFLDAQFAVAGDERKHVAAEAQREPVFFAPAFFVMAFLLFTALLVFVVVVILFAVFPFIPKMFVAVAAVEKFPIIGKMVPEVEQSPSLSGKLCSSFASSEAQLRATLA